ncbi:hypothetical protein QQS21_007423 [Conoideocrella luteorostrata]|uniref:WD40 repeat-like protein n=1 Tax=Conoideocrella luteorostrata TaxID=1105319 RepID=A0AAJ0CKS1_9HYPO|nr:hypothetical protein QQS21_007423 [Conoideocrella luteorostrata]
MSVALMDSTPRVVIDLTLDEPTTTATSRPTLSLKHARSAPAAAAESPAKRRRINSTLAKHFVKELLLPHVQRAVEDGLSDREYCVQEIAVEQTITILLKTTTFLKKAEAGNGILTSQEQKEIKSQVELVVAQLAELPQYYRQESKVEPSPSRQIPQLPTILTPIPKSSEISTPITSLPVQRLYTGPTRIPKFRKFPQRIIHRGKSARGASPDGSTLAQLQEKPYLSVESRDSVARGRDTLIQSQDIAALPVTYHVDFSGLEIAEIVDTLEKRLSLSIAKTQEALAQVSFVYDIPSFVGHAIHGRTRKDIQNLCSDVRAGKANWSKPQVLSLQKSNPESLAQNRRANRVSSMLLARELEGNVGFGRMRQYENFQNQFRICHEDGLSVVAEFTNCAGDITAMSWAPNDNIICGTTAHSDAHNQQYNKPGNLLLCSTKRGTLQAFADHKIPRPLVKNGENSTAAMRESQDPWLYSSVVSTDYDEITGRAFTSSFDRTVKVWNMSKARDSMEAIATWHHDGNVNFVAAAKDGSGRVATAADVPTSAVRIYAVNPNDVQTSQYYTVSCTRNDADGSEKWAYLPATMQWGQARDTRHLLVIGYSPRSLRNDDSEIPEDKLRTGEIVLWDAERGVQVPVLTVTTANVFEALWHPTLPRFIVATSPSGLIVEQGTRTNIHIFEVDRDRQDGAYSEIQKLDCPALDINELTIMPNSLRYAFITAGCTDGRVYVWDTAQGDRPIHTLQHGNPVDDFTSDREKEDTGIKFTAWGTTTDRLYTGSSDGVIKAWNVLRQRDPFIRNLLEAPGPISCGVFSPDHSKLVVGDGTGRVFLLSVDKRDEIESHFTTPPGSNRRIRRPKQFTPHAEPPPPPGTNSTLSDAEYARETYLDSNQLILHHNPTIGAVQGPAYPSTGLFRTDAHIYSDPQGPLLPKFERNQRCVLDASMGARSRSIRRLKSPGAMATCSDAMAALDIHAANISKDLDVEALSSHLIDELVRHGAQLQIDGDEGWEFEYEETCATLGEDSEPPPLGE